MRKVLKIAAYFLVAMFVFIACRKEKVNLSTPIRHANKPPVAYAGDDKTIILPVNSIVLNGSGKDDDGYIRSYVWTDISGPITFNMVDKKNGQVELKDLVRGIYTFQLKVTDNQMSFATDNAVVYVLDSLNDPLTIDPWGY